ncbi:uncharacterized protein BYT42DRAFT_647033 [Radiomyces spectabilis]|uniref:uncharacterized protein n=1 Tax=Radiomyces spectabilis TaxID=64574 RepID=UPI00221F2D86|nr:uncharacterized protein BYT42DRAFT_647033 [Radiomyces spectabilis]KAI8373090.1 hypothetical protein BYT42DRAFT_647033 [Radiomyces spectabilis]
MDQKGYSYPPPSYQPPPQAQYYNQYPPPQPQGYYQPTPPPQTVYVQQQPQSHSNDMCWGCLAACCICCALDAIF